MCKSLHIRDVLVAHPVKFPTRGLFQQSAQVGGQQVAPQRRRGRSSRLVAELLEEV